MKRLVTTAVTVIGLASCNGDRAPAAQSLHRDSAGVDIVENGIGAGQRGESWTIGAEPFVAVRQMEDHLEHSPLDPASVYRHGGSRILIADGMSAGLNQILEFDSTGEFVRAIGRRGKGPCEFQQLYWVAAYRNDSIGAYDYATHSITVFDSVGKCGRTLRLPHIRASPAPGTYPFSEGADGFFADGSVLASSEGAIGSTSRENTAWYEHTLLRVSPDGSKADTLGAFKLWQVNWNGSKQGQRPFSPYAVRAIAGQDILHSTGENLQFSRYNPEGRLIQIVRVAGSPTPLSEAEKRAFIDAYVEQIRVAPFEGGEVAAERARTDLNSAAWPTEKPAISALIADSLGFVWAGEYVNSMVIADAPDSTQRKWHVFRPNGEIAASLEMSAKFSPSSIYRDAVFGIWTNADDVKEVRAYKLKRGK